MIRLRVLGAIDLRDPAGRELRELLVQPKRMALLVYLALGRTGALHRRDTLVSLFWPESRQEHARGALSQALSYLRQVLGPGVVVTRGSEEVGLSPECIWCDACAFDAEFEAGRYEEALAHYRDHLLSGFHAGTSAAFEDWLSAERSRLLERATRAAWALAERDLQQRLTSSAVSWARRAIALSSCGETDLRRFLGELHALGDHAGAIRIYDAFAERLRLEYDIEPARETRELAAAVASNDRKVDIPVRTAPREPGVSQTVAADAARESSGQPPVYRRRNIATAAGLILVAMSGLGLVLRTPALPMVAGAAAAVTFEPGIEMAPSLSPDGKLVAYGATDLVTSRVYVRGVAGGRAIAIAADTLIPYWAPKWSPDGSTILVQSPGRVSLVSPAGGPHRQVLRAPEGSLRSAGWSPDGRELHFVRNDSLFTRTLEGPGERFVGYSRELHSCAWSSRGLIACVVGNVAIAQRAHAFANIAPSHLVIFPMQGARQRGTAVTDSAALHVSPAWSPDGKWLYFVSNRHGPRDVYSMRISSRGVPESEPVKLTTGANAMTIAVGSDGKRLAYAVFVPRVNVGSIPLSADGIAAAPRAHTFGNQVVESMKVSADGEWLYYDSNLRGNADIYRVRTDGGEPRQLTFDAADDFNPDVSADGREVTFHSLRSGNRDIFTMPVEGDRAEQVTFTKAHELAPRWSPDGRALVFNDVTGETIFLARRAANGAWTHETLPARGVRPQWSPDGRRLVARSVRPAGQPTGPIRRAIVIAPIDSGTSRVAYQPATGDPQPFTPVWSADGSEILFKTMEGGRVSFWSIGLGGGRPRLLARADSSVRSFSPAWTTDGRRFYFPVENHESDIWLIELRSGR